MNSFFNRSVQKTSNTERQTATHADRSIIVNAQMSLDEEQALQLLEDMERSPAEEYYTLAGYLLAHFDAIPQPGDSIDTGSYICTVLSMNGQRIDQVAIKKKN